MNNVIKILIVLLVVVSCKKEELDTTPPDEENKTFIYAADISRLPEISETNPLFYGLDGKQDDYLSILKSNGINTIRLKLWVNPEYGHSGFDEVKRFCSTLRSKGFKIWLNLHYSDTWADPGHQLPPKQWQGIPFSDLKDSVYRYTGNVVDIIQPEYIQIGNEINTGFLHPYGHIISNRQQFIELLKTGISAVRANSVTNTLIMLHYAGIKNAQWFFDKVNGLDYDIMGLSYYPKWHGKSLDSLKSTIQQLSETYGKKIVIAETAYPFTLGWNDWTKNAVGIEEQLILPEYPATPEGQKDFIEQIITITQNVENGIGVCYWGAEMIAWKGKQAKDGSTWENQALFDFNNKALPVFKAFKTD